MDMAQRIDAALAIAVRYGGVDGDHHKAWVIDQMVRELTNCPRIMGHGVDVNGVAYEYPDLGESDEYKALVAGAKDGEDGPETYEWNEGIAP